MKKNVGTTDKVLRLILAACLLSLLVILPGPAKWFGLVGLVPLATALLGWCPAYTLFGFSTCPTAQRKDDKGKIA
ncbi:MAG TPA: DUF2892 domain-containing protein [Noviherbaspirillum sp.]